VESLDRLLKGLALNEAHGVTRLALGVVGQGIHRHDARVLQPGGDLGFDEEAAPALGVLGMAFEQPLEGDLAIQPFVVSDKYLAKSAAGMGRQQGESTLVLDRRHRIRPGWN
jgi:hypothetical protein